MEKFESHHSESAALDGELIANRANQLRTEVLSDMSLIMNWQDELHEWDKQFKTRLEEKFGSRQYAQQVPAWQKLVGGTPEPETNITSEQRDFILGEVDAFLTRFSSENDIELN